MLCERCWVNQGRKHNPSLPHRSGPQGRAFVLFTLGGLILVAFILRLLYLGRISLYIDEFTTMWAAKRILKYGLPWTPAGVLYLRGVLFTYLDALFIYLLGFSEGAARLPSVLVGVLSIALIYLLGRRLFSPTVGLVAAALLTFAPEAIVWSGRARMYALAQLWVLLAAFFLYEIERPKYRWAFLLSFWGAVFAHEEAMILYPALLLAMALRQGWRWLLGRRGISLNLLSMLAVVSRYGLDKVGRGQLEAVQTIRPYLQFPAGVGGNFRAYSRFFLEPQQLPLTLLLLLGLLYLGGRWVKRVKGGALERPRIGEPGWEKGLVFLLILFGTPLLVMVAFAGSTWRDSRYLFLLLPFFYLIASAVSVEVIDWMVGHLTPTRREKLRWPATLSLVVLASSLQLPGGLSVLSTQIEGYDLAFRYVRDHWQEGDVVITASPTASAVYLDRCDYYAIQRDYEQYIVEKGGLLVDRWVGAPLLNTVPELERVLKENPRVWFVIDGWRLATRYQMGFREVIVRAMESVYEVQGVKVLLSQGYAEAEEPAIDRSLEVKLKEGVSLLGYELSATSLEPGEELRLTLYWQAERRLKEEYTIFVHLLNREGVSAAQGDSPPMRGLYPTIYWQEGERVVDEHRFPVADDAPSGRYLLEVGVYSPQSGERLAVVDEMGEAIDDRIVLDYIQIGRERARPQHPANAEFGSQIMLVGYDFDGPEKRLSVEPGQAISLTLYWQALTAMGRDHTVFVHLLDEEARIWGQRDSQPLDGFYPTSFWDVGELIEDEYELTVDPDAPEGNYTLVAGLYFPPTGERLRLPGGEGDMVILGRITVVR